MSEYPILIVTEDLTTLYRNLGRQGFVINVVTNVDELRQFFSRFSGVIVAKPIILSDLSRLGIYQARILKFIEENPSPIICISSEDCITSVLLSRFMTIIKHPNIVENERDKPLFIMDRLLQENEQMTIVDLIRHAPSVIFTWDTMRRVKLPSKEKIMQLVFS